MKKFIAALTLVTLVCLCYVHAEVEIVKIGYRIRKQEEARTLLQDRQRALRYNMARLKAPSHLEQKLQAKKIMLSSPASWQTLMMPSERMRAGRASATTTIPMGALLAKFFVGTAQAESNDL